MRRSNVYWNECLLALSNRSGLRRVSPPHFTARFQSRRSVTSQTTMPSADFSIAVRIDCSILSQNSVARDFSKGTMETSRGKTQSFQRVNAGFIKHTPIADGGLRGHVPTRPGCTTPQIRFLYVAPRFWIGLPSNPASRRRPCPSPNLWFRENLVRGLAPR